MSKKIIKDKFYVGLVNELDDNDKRKKRYAKWWAKHGWEPTQLWNLDITLAGIIHKYLVLYKNNAEAVIDFDIDKIITAFKLIKEEKYIPSSFDLLNLKETNKIINEGLQLFANNFTKLWS